MIILFVLVVFFMVSFLVLGKVYNFDFNDICDKKLEGKYKRIRKR